MSNMRWTLLIGGSGSSRSKNAANQPQQRLTKFKRSYNQALTLCHKLNNTSVLDPTSLDLVQTHLQRLTSLLEDDTRDPSPHLCMGFAASSFVYTALSRIVISLKYEPVTRDIVSFFAILVDSDEENLLATERFAETLMTFVDGILGLDASFGGPDTQNETLELIFGIAAKIRLEPELLPVWFRKKPQTQGVSEKQGTEQTIQQDDFPLCHHFVWHVYRDGRAGDFARTGLLYILESASNSKVLESWIALSDLPTLMASGLGGLYSQLSRKLSIARPKEDTPLILALSDSAEHHISSEADSFFSEDLQSRLDTFMSYIVFWQDVLEHCYSSEIKETLLECFQVEFLQQILYPSLLQSSDIDGGSSVAVLTYVCRILDSVDHPDIIHLMLHYLLDLPGPLASRPPTRDSPLASRRQKSLTKLGQVDEHQSTPNPSFFNLTDLILASCQSRNPETVTAALRLVATVIDKHHGYAITSLLKTTPFSISAHQKRIGALERELEDMVSIATTMAGVEGLDEAYESSTRDSLAYIEGHPCSSQVMALETPEKPRTDRRGAMLNGETSQMHTHSMSSNDPFLKQLIALLRTFLTNDIETNLGLTGAFSHLASCPYVRLEGWLVREAVSSFESQQSEDGTLDNKSTSNQDSDEEERKRIKAYKMARQRTTRDLQDILPFTQALQFLAHSVAALKSDIPEFESLLAGRKRAFQGATELENEMREPTPSILSSPRGSLDISRDVSQSRRPVPVLTPSKPTPREARSPSPRGRTLSLLAGQGKQSPTNSPRPPPSPQRPLPFKSPSLKAQDTPRRSSKSPIKAARAFSPLAASPDANSERSRSPLKSSAISQPPADEEIFDRRLRFPVGNTLQTDGQTSADAAAHATSEQNGVRQDSTLEDDYNEASLTHVLTNVVILQEFILELAAIIHVRAGLLDGEVSFLNGYDQPSQDDQSGGGSQDNRDTSVGRRGTEEEDLYRTDGDGSEAAD